MSLPQDYLQKMEQQLGIGFGQFLSSYTKPRVAGLRANSLKISKEELQKLLPYLEERISWSSDGFYYEDDSVRPAKHPYYYAGLYYIQEPSAMLPAELLNAEQGDVVLDLCAAPGGKSIQLAAQIGRAGLLVVNDINQQRAKVLLKNIERYGVVNAVVLNETPERLSTAFPHFFNKILVDAPCSGEGMFRKEPDMIKEWSSDSVAKYRDWQQDILATIPSLLSAGGKVVYSTCTFSVEENEQQINNFISQHHDFELLEANRLWPHEVKGEGHFAAVIKKQDNPSTQAQVNKRVEPLPLATTTEQVLAEFSQQVWGNIDEWRQWLPAGGNVVERSGHIVWESALLPSLKGLKVLRSGWLLGTIEKGRFKPSVAFALGLPREAVCKATQTLDLADATLSDPQMAVRYLRGETIQWPGRTWQKGWYLISLAGYPLGWAKSAGNYLKNEYPPGWRWIN